MNGFGVMNWSSGEQFKGYFANNYRHGEGVFSWKDG